MSTAIHTNEYRILNVRTWLGVSLVFVLLSILALFVFFGAVQYGLSTGLEGVPSFNWDEYWGRVGGFFGGVGTFVAAIITIAVLIGMGVGSYIASSAGFHWLIAIIVPVMFLLGGFGLGVIFYVWGIDWLGMLLGIVALLVMVGISMLLAVITLAVGGAFNRLRRNTR